LVKIIKATATNTCRQSMVSMNFLATCEMV
jgi:hypothetical protein